MLAKRLQEAYVRIVEMKRLRVKTSNGDLLQCAYLAMRDLDEALELLQKYKQTCTCKKRICKLCSETKHLIEWHKEAREA